MIPLDLSPELQELTYTGKSDTGVSFTPSTNARQNDSGGRPVILVRQSQAQSSSESPYEGPTITSARGDAGNDSVALSCLPISQATHHSLYLCQLSSHRGRTTTFSLASSRSGSPLSYMALSYMHANFSLILPVPGKTGSPLK